MRKFGGCFLTRKLKNKAARQRLLGQLYWNAMVARNVGLGAHYRCSFSRQPVPHVCSQQRLKGPPEGGGSRETDLKGAPAWRVAQGHLDLSAGRLSLCSQTRLTPHPACPPLRDAPASDCWENFQGGGPGAPRRSPAKTEHLWGRQGKSCLQVYWQISCLKLLLCVSWSSRG